MIFYSGLALPAALRERYPSACVCKKPTPPVQLLHKLVALMRTASRGARLAATRSGDICRPRGLQVGAGVGVLTERASGATLPRSG